MAGMNLDPWEELVLVEALGERDDGHWSAFEVGLVAPRQNGKNEILIARELAGLFLLEERLIVHSAHEFATSEEAFLRLTEVIEGCPDFTRRTKRITKSHGAEGVELMDRRRIRFRTRTKGGGRGFSSDCLILDEAMEISEMAHGALLPTLSARPNPQVWLTGSAVDQWVQQNGVVFSRIRERGLKGNDPALAYFEWSLDCEDPENVGNRAEDPSEWAIANPGLGIRISAEHIEHERHAMDPRTFAVERLGVGDWPAIDGSGGVIDQEIWAAGVDTKSKPADPVCFAFDVTPDRSFASIGVAGLCEGGLVVDVVNHRRGTGWVAKRLEELVAKHQTDEVICDGSGPAANLITEVEDRGIEVKATTAKEHSQACGTFYDACEQKTLRHLNQPELNAAVKGAKKRPLGDAWAWSRKTSTVDISPLVACTLAAWGVTENQARGELWVMTSA